MRPHGRVVALGLALLIAPALGACSHSDKSGPPRIDMSTDESAARTIGQVRDSLDEAQRRELTDATMVLVRRAMGVDRAAALDPDKAKVAVKQVLDGKTANQIIAEAQAIEAADKPLPVGPGKAGGGAGAP